MPLLFPSLEEVLEIFWIRESWCLVLYVHLGKLFTGSCNMCSEVGPHIHGMSSETGDPVRLRYSCNSVGPYSIRSSHLACPQLWFSCCLAGTTSWVRLLPGLSTFYGCVGMVRGPLQNSYQFIPSPRSHDCQWMQRSSLTRL